ncbi:YheC/YheD family protein [Paenibacillus sp. GCM10023250]|uniref:YheC/YheD family protein n=1 Tax=Paenibacillus sp. GCM10023250 TaxID=3252648 RepID=UPI0036068EAD
MPGKGGSSISIKNKWTKTKWLLADRRLKSFVPKTKPYTRSSLNAMTGRYKMVYFKPTSGTGGGGIARIVRSSRKFRVKKDGRTFEVSSKASLYGRLNKIARGRSYLLQKGIYLQSSRGRPFDLRVTMQKTAAGKWVQSVMFVKLGRKNKVVTNYHQGGKLAYIEPTLRRSGYSRAQINRYRKRLKSIGMQTARCFDRHAKRFKELGLDVALDRGGRLWILEVNTRPNYSALKSLGDKRFYRTIVRYGKQYGRSK